jgi:SAM-dependent methyltransferase
MSIVPTSHATPTKADAVPGDLPLNGAAYARKHHYVGDKAKHYDAGRIGPQSSPIARHRWHEELRAVESIAAALPHASTILDIPCGTGRFFPILASHGHKVIGGDVSRDMLDAIPAEQAAQTDIRPIRADAEEIPLADGAVDTVLAVRFWSFLPDDARRRVLAEWRRVARHGVYVQVRVRTEPGSRPCVSKFQPTDGAPIDDGVTPEQRANWPTAMEFARMAAEAGFAIDATIALDWGPTSDPVIICHLRPATATV